MAKKLVYNYVFTPAGAGLGTLVVKGNWKQRSLQLITNVTDGIILFNFADPDAGATTSYDSDKRETTIVLEQDTASMSADDEIQIFVDTEFEEVEFGESFVDPVHKLRVSNPENLIDTDFEYGLQSSKWETIELVNNIPSVYTIDGGISLSEIQSVTTINGAALITVTTGVPHELSVGDPIEVQGLTSRTAQGKFLVTNVESTTKFAYKSTDLQTASKDVSTAYTTILPGTFFASSDIEFDVNESISTDGASPSTISLQTAYSHGLSTSTSVYITNTVGKKTFSISTTSGVADDGAATVRTSDSSIYVPNHNLFNNQRIYITPDTTANPAAQLPYLNTGAPLPNSETTIRSAYQGVKDAADTLQNLMESATPNAKSRLYMNYSSSVYSAYQSGNRLVTSVDGGDTHRQYLRHGYYSYAYFYLRNASSGYNYYRWYSYGEPNSTLLTGQPVDIGQYFQRITYSGGGGLAAGPGTLANKGMYMMNTPYTANAYTPYIISIIQQPKPDDLTPGAIRGALYDTFYGSRYVWGYNSRDSYVNVNTPTNIAGGWQYTYAASYLRPNDTGSQYMGFIYLRLLLDNTNWDGHYGTNMNWYQIGTRYLWARPGTSYSAGKGPCYNIELLLPVDDSGDPGATRYGTGGTVFDFAAMANTVATSVISRVEYPSWSDPVGVNTVYTNVINSNRISLTNNPEYGSTYGFTGVNTAPWTIETDQTSGVVDDYYSLSGVTSTTVSIASSATISPRVLEFDTVGVQTHDAASYIHIPSGHGLSDGQKVVYNTVTGSDIAGLSSGTTYFALVNSPYYLGLSTTTEDWQAETSIISVPANANGNYNLTVNSIAGRVAAAGTIAITSTTSSVVDGYNTRFTSNYSAGDDFFITGIGTLATYVKSVVASVVSDTKLQLQDAPGITTSGTSHYVDTKVNMRADGEFVHRPFDGGVEITAGTSPDSSVVRQTRKYFRYQSGKGIQCSVAINFNPSRPAQSATGSGSNITVTTEYPHGLTSLDKVRITGAEERIQYTPSTASYDSATGDLTVTINGHGFLVDEYVELKESSFVFTCAKDSHATLHPYPRNSDPAGRGERLRIKSVTTNTFVVNVGSSTYVGAHTISSIGTNAVTHINTSNAYNGLFDVTASTDLTFSYTSGSIVNQSPATGFVEYAISGYANAGVRCGLFDFQNGFFYEYDGKSLYAVRRSSVQQCAGTVTCALNSNIIIGEGTKFQDQLKNGDMIVLRGQSYKVTDIRNQTELHIQPKYRGATNNGVIVTKTVDTRIKQSDWNLDVCDGTGTSAFNLDINKIQMAYFDYSWYGAGKIRFGFKDTNGRVRYVHEFLHNNELNEAYMRSGNIAGRYEVFNRGIPTYIPSLFHWGTSVIMDGKFDNDDSYLFTAAGNSLSFTNGASQSVNATGNSFLSSSGWGSSRIWYVILRVAPSDASKFTTGIGLWTADEELDGHTVSFVRSFSSVAYVYVQVGTGYNSPALYPNVPNSTAISIGSPAGAGDEAVDVSTLIPLISIRLAPSVDNGLIGSLGQRDIINRMQLKMKELGISVSHNSTVSVILNGNLSNVSYGGVGTPSLSQYIPHASGDTIDGGVVIYKFRASGGEADSAGKRTSVSSAFSLEGLSDLGNSILGGDGVFPNGPDVMTICVSAIDSSEVSAQSIYAVSARLSWSESQA